MTNQPKVVVLIVSFFLVRVGSITRVTRPLYSPKDCLSLQIHTTYVELLANQIFSELL